MNVIKYGFCFTVCKLFSYSLHGKCIFGIPIDMTALYVKLCHLNCKNSMCSFSEERGEVVIGAKSKVGW